MGVIKKWCKGTSNGPCMDSKLKKLLEGPCIWARFLGKGEQLLGVTFIFFPELQQRPGRCEVALWEGITAVQWSSAGVTAPWPDEPPACGSCVPWPAWCQLCSRGLFVTTVVFFFVWDWYHQQEMMDKKGMGEVVDAKAQLMVNWSCAHSCVWRWVGPCGPLVLGILEWL